MEKYIYVLVVMCLCSFLVACGGDNSNSSQPVVDSTVTTSTPTPETNTSEPNPVAEMSAEESKQAVAEATKLTKQLRDTYSKMKNIEPRYVENVPFTSFIGIAVEAAEFEIVKVNDQLTRVQVDYFDGSPTGGKRFFVNNGELFAVEIVRLTEEQSEKGSGIVEKVSHTCYYKGGKLAQIWDNKAQQEVDAKTIAWINENLEQWETVKKSI